MSADRHRGIRRQKQKRAKQHKKQARELRSPAGTQASEQAAPAAVAHNG